MSRIDRIAEALRRVDYMNWPAAEVAEKIDGTIAAIEQEARAEALRRVEAAVRAMDKYGTGEWSDPSNWRVDYLEVLAVIRDTPEET